MFGARPTQALAGELADFGRTLEVGAAGKFVVQFSPPAGCHWNTEAHSKWQIRDEGPEAIGPIVIADEVAMGEVPPTGCVEVPFVIDPAALAAAAAAADGTTSEGGLRGSIVFETAAMVCENDGGTCLMPRQGVRASYVVSLGSGADPTAVDISLDRPN